MYDQLVDRLMFGVTLALIAAFILVLKKGLRVEISFEQFVEELRAIAEGRWTREALNALAMIISFIMSLFVFIAIFVSAWRGLAYTLLGADPQSVPVIPPLTAFGMVFGSWFLMVVLCFVYTARK